jgi:hypothetical protein
LAFLTFLCFSPHLYKQQPSKELCPVHKLVVIDFGDGFQPVPIGSGKETRIYKYMKNEEREKVKNEREKVKNEYKQYEESMCVSFIFL